MKRTILLVNKKEYGIRFPINAYADYEEMCGKGIGTLVGEQAAIMISDLRRLLYLGLMYGENETITLEKGMIVSGKLIEESVREHESLDYLTEIVDRAIEESVLPIIVDIENTDDPEKK